MTRHLIGVLALAATASIAGAQQPTSKETPKRDTVTTSSSGEVARSTRAKRPVGYSTRAVPRDWVGADDTRGDDLWRHEQMMDKKCGKDRDRCGKP